MCKLGFSPLARATGFGLTTFLLPCSLLNAALLHKEARFFFVSFFLLSKSKFYRLGHLSIPSYVVLFILNCNEGQTEEGIRSDRRFCLCFGEIFVAQEASWFGLLSTSLDTRDA